MGNVAVEEEWEKLKGSAIVANKLSTSCLKAENEEDSKRSWKGKEKTVGW
jgi:hypothetical protein